MARLQKQMKKLVAFLAQIVEHHISLDVGVSTFATVPSIHDPFLYKATGELMGTIAICSQTAEYASVLLWLDFPDHSH